MILWVSTLNPHFNTKKVKSTGEPKMYDTTPTLSLTLNLNLTLNLTLTLTLNLTLTLTLPEHN